MTAAHLAQESAPEPSRRRIVTGSLSYYRQRPLELLDRLRSEAERRLERTAAAPPMTHPVGTATQAVHEVLDVAEDCPLCADFTDVWADITARFPNTNHHDSGLATVAGAWTATRHLQPSAVVETGVARGFTTAAILAALDRNQNGHLWSIDLPEVNLLLTGQAAAAVAPHLIDRWTWMRGSSRRLLPPLLTELGALDVFLHDSLHTRANMLFEMRTAWLALRPGGLLLVDDIGDNLAFQEFVASVDGRSTVRQQGNRAGAFGVIRKP